MNALAFQGVEVRGKRCHERLAFAGFHFRDLPAVQHDAADELDVEVPHCEHATPRLAHHRKGFGQEIVGRFAVREALAELRRLSAELLVGELFDLRFFGVDGGDEWTQSLQVTLVLRADDFRQKSVNNHQEGSNQGIQ